MGRPLRKEFLNKIKINYYKNGTLTTTTLVKQIGFNRFVTADESVLVLSTPTFAQANEGYGYVIVTDTKTSGTKYLNKLTKNLIATTDSSVYPFVFESTVEDTFITSISQNNDAPAIIDGLCGEEKIYGLDLTDYTYDVTGNVATLTKYNGANMTVVVPTPAEIGE